LSPDPLGRDRAPGRAVCLRSCLKRFR
jgi:hypothetical protein